MKKRLFVLLLSLVIIVFLTSCLKREVTISINEDGSCQVHIIFSGDKDDLYNGCLLPNKTKWAVKEYMKEDEKGKKIYFYEATAHFKTPNDIPSSFVTEGTRYSAAYLHTPVEFKIRKDGGKTIYEFKQTYKARRWVDLEEKQVELMDFDVLLTIKKKGIDSLTDEQKPRFYKGIVEFEKWKIEDKAERAISRVAEDLAISNDQKAKLMSAIKSYLNETITQEVIDGFLKLPQSQQTERESKLREKIDEGIQQRIIDTLGIKETSKPYKRIKDSINFVEKDDEITEDLGDDSFSITVQMPGTITDTNATTIEGVENNIARWEFSGDELRGDDFVITAVSTLEK